MRAREWIRGRRDLGEFNGVPANELTLPEDELHEQLRELQAEISLLVREIEVKEELVELARKTMEQQRRGTLNLFDTPDLTLTMTPFKNWVEEVEETIELCRDNLLRLRGKREELSKRIEVNLNLTGEDPTQPQADTREAT